MPYYVTAEVRDLGSEWEAYAYPGEGVFRVTAPTRPEVETLFISSWNSGYSTSYAPEEFDFILST